MAPTRIPYEVPRDYTTISNLGNQHTIVKHNASGRLFVQKNISHFNMHAYHQIKQNPHAQIATVYDFWQTAEGQLCIIEEYVNGQTLLDYLKQHGLLTDTEAIDIALQLCAALIHLHGMQPPVIHRDIKLTNIMIDEQKRVKLIDFDIARTYQPEQKSDTTILGTAGFAAPEQFGFTQTDARTDIYAMGVVLNYLCAGNHHHNAPHKGPLGKIIQKCLQIDPKNRYSNVFALQEALLAEKNQPNVPKQVAIRHPFYKNIPGFRTGSAFKVILACLIYLCILTLPLWFTESKTMPYFWLLDIAYMFIFLALFLLYTNFLNIQHHLKLFQANSNKQRAKAYTLYSLAIVFGILFIYAIILNILS